MKYSLLFPATIGLADGIITALVLVTGSILSGAGLSPGLSERVAFGSAFVGTFSFFIAEYSRLRGEINKTSRQLNLSSPRLLGLLIPSLHGSTFQVPSQKTLEPLVFPNISPGVITP